MGEILLLQLFLTLLFVEITGMLKISLHPVFFPISWVLGFFFPLIRTKSLGIFFKTLFFTILIWGFSIFIAEYFVDPSFDGIVYHQEIIAALMRGWYPGGNEITGMPLSVWALHYPKGFEMIQAGVASTFNSIEAGKSVNIIIATCATFFSYNFLYNYVFPQSKVKTLLVAIVALASPVFLCQVLSFYLDFAKYFYSVISIVLILEIGLRPKTKAYFYQLCIIIIMTASTKYNTFFEEGMIIFAACVWWVIKNQFKLAFRIAAYAFAAAIIGSIVLNFNPYITNLLDHGNILYPLAGEGSIDIMTGNTPDKYLHANRFFSFIHSILYMEPYMNTDTRMGGYGPLMGILSIISCIIIILKRRELGGIPFYIFIWTLASCFIFEQSWWARYITQLWIIIVIGFALSLLERKYRILSWIIALAVAGNSCFCIVASIKASIRIKIFRTVVNSNLRNQEIEFYGLSESFNRHLQENHITPIIVNQPDSSKYQIAYFWEVDDLEHNVMAGMDSITYYNIVDKLYRYPLDFSMYIGQPPINKK